MLTKIAQERYDKDKAEKNIRRYWAVEMDGRMKKTIKTMDGLISLLQMYGYTKLEGKHYFFIADPKDGKIIEAFKGNNGAFSKIYTDEEIEKEFGDIVITQKGEK